MSKNYRVEFEVTEILLKIDLASFEPIFIFLLFSSYIWAARKHYIASKNDAARIDLFIGGSYLMYALLKLSYLLLPAL